MAEHSLIAAYIVELRHSVADLPDADDIAAEAEDHLMLAADRYGELEALARFGTPSLVAHTFIEESRKGAAVPTTFTKRAGLIAALSPLLLALGAWANELTGRGAAHGGAVIIEALAFPAVLIGILGLRTRHGGLGLLGRIALTFFLMAPLFSIFIPWAGIVFTGSLWTAAFALLGVAMLRAGILPRVPVILFGFSAIATVAVALVVTAFGGDAGQLWYVPLVSQFIGFTWLGWAMWREEAVATPGPGPWASAAA